MSRNIKDIVRVSVLICEVTHPRNMSRRVSGHIKRVVTVSVLMYGKMDCSHVKYDVVSGHITCDGVQGHVICEVSVSVLICEVTCSHVTCDVVSVMCCKVMQHINTYISSHKPHDLKYNSSSFLRRTS